MLSSGANVIIWDEMLSSKANVIMVSSGANVIIWCYHVMLSSGMITPPFLFFLETSLTRSNVSCEFKYSKKSLFHKTIFSVQLKDLSGPVLCTQWSKKRVFPAICSGTTQKLSSLFLQSSLLCFTFSKSYISGTVLLCREGFIFLPCNN